MTGLDLARVLCPGAPMTLSPSNPRLRPADMTLEQRSSLVLAFARVLYVNGQATEQTVAAAEQLGRMLGLRAKVMPRWGELRLQSEDENAGVISEVAADPTGVDMDRVASAARAVGELGAGRLAPPAAAEAIAAISRAPPAPTWLFTLAAGAGAWVYRSSSASSIQSRRR